MRTPFFYIILCVASFLASCVKDKPNPDTKSFPTNLSHGLVVLNEGSFGNNNSDISYINLENQIVSNSLFKIVNGHSLGDVAQFITLINGTYYVCINNSNKIVVLDIADFSLRQTIHTIDYPRYMAQYSQDIAFVSSLYRPYVSVVQLSTNTCVDTIFTEHFNSEQMLVANNILWICQWDTACNYIQKVDATTHHPTEKVSIPGFAPHDILQDKNGTIWVLSGNKYKGKSAHLTCINPQTNEVLKSFSFSASADPIKLTINESKDTLYFINVNYTGNSSNNGLYKMGIDENALPSIPFIQAPVNTYFWGLGIDSKSKHIFLSDPKGFTQNSTIYEYTNAGKSLNVFQTGIGSNQFIFR